MIAGRSGALACLLSLVPLSLARLLQPRRVCRRQDVSRRASRSLPLISEAFSQRSQVATRLSRYSRLLARQPHALPERVTVDQKGLAFLVGEKRKGGAESMGPEKASIAKLKSAKVSCISLPHLLLAPKL